LNKRTTTVEALDQSKELAELRRAIPGYTPEWSPGVTTKASAVTRIFARYLELLNEGLDQAPDRSLLAFLDMMGTNLLPAQAARAPLVFNLIDGSPVDVTLPSSSEVAAPVQPKAPSAIQTNPGQSEPIIFATDKTVTLTRSRLDTLYSINPGSDEFADHSAHLTDGFTLFDDMGLTEHAIYLGHDQLFALAGDITVLLSFTFEAPAARELKTTWEYLSQSGWLPFESLEQDDTTQGMRKDGQITLRRECGPNAKEETFFEHKSFWLRGRLTTPLLPDGTADQRTVPVINDIRARVGFNKSGLLPEAAFTEGVPLDTTKHFYPFGQQPARYSAFYLASREVFSRKGARVGIVLNLSEDVMVHGSPELEWEFYDGAAWSPLGVEAPVGTEKFIKSGTISFYSPRNWEETDMNGVKNFWLRARITKGDYGQPVLANVVPTRKVRTIKDITNNPVEVDSNQGNAAGAEGAADAEKIAEVTIDSDQGNQGYAPGDVVVLIKGNVEETVIIDHLQGDDKLVLTKSVPIVFIGGTVATPALIPATLQPPVVSSLTLGYTYLTDPEAPDHCLSLNDFVSEDHTEDCRWPDQTFKPFRPVADTQGAVHFGFDRALPVGLVSLYVDVPQAAEDTVSDASPFQWEYRSARGWNELGVLDETLGFRRSGMIQFIGQPDAAPVPGLGGERFRVRARLKPGESLSSLSVAGIWLNAVWATQSRSIDRESLGVSDGAPGQTFFHQRKPVLEGEMLEVQEWTGRGEHWRTSVQGVPESELRFERDPATDIVTAVWTRWRVRAHLYSSSPTDRHYVIERAQGLIRFGDGRQGMIPPAGSRIAVSYRSGGGLAGNVPAGTITELHTGTPFVASATNPSPALGGAAIESDESVRSRGPQRLRHHDRAVSATDFEWLAREASPDVARARCLPITGPDGHAQRGWVTVVVVPFSRDARPALNSELRRRVREHLSRRAPAAVARRVRIIGPQYAPIGVQAEIAPIRPDEAAAVEARVREALNRFLHPLTGGPNWQGWNFGQSVYLSQIAKVIEGAEGVDYARKIRLRVNDQIFDEFVQMDTDMLAAAGDHTLKLIVGEN
jgi:uncharacterized phage protein gp47/JayE